MGLLCFPTNLLLFNILPVRVLWTLWCFTVCKQMRNDEVDNEAPVEAVIEGLVVLKKKSSFWLY
jgi:hypothetical protein